MEEDTIKLLRECDSGIKMGLESINDVIDQIESDKLKKVLLDSKKEHEALQSRTQNLLDTYHDEGKDPSPIIKGMSWIKTNMRLAVNNSDNTIADLMTEGANMGIKSLSKYLNEYEYSNELSKNVVKDLIKVEENLVFNLREFL